MTSYRNKNLTNELTETSTVFLDPYMPHFSGQEVSFSWFTLTKWFQVEKCSSGFNSTWYMGDLKQHAN